MTKEQKDQLCRMFSEYGNLTAKEEHARHNDLLNEEEKAEKVKKLQLQQQDLIKEFTALLNEV